MTRVLEWGGLIKFSHIASVTCAEHFISEDNVVGTEIRGAGVPVTGSGAGFCSVFTCPVVLGHCR